MEAVLLLEGKACRCLWPGRLVPTCFLGFLGFLPPDLLLRRARRASGRSGAHSTLSNRSSQQHILLCDKLNRAPRHRPFSLAILRSPRLSRQRLRHGTSPETQRCGDWSGVFDNTCTRSRGRCCFVKYVQDGASTTSRNLRKGCMARTHRKAVEPLTKLKETKNKETPQEMKLTPGV